jgi:hypothetical protein
LIAVAEDITVEVSTTGVSVVNVLIANVSMVDIPILLAVSMEVVLVVDIADVDSSDDETPVDSGESSDVDSDVESDHSADNVIDTAGLVVDAVNAKVDCMNPDDVDAVEDDEIAFEAKMIPVEDRVPISDSIK